MSTREKIREELKQRYRYTFVFLCSLQGWHTVDMVPDGIIKEAERCEDAFVDGWLEYQASQGVVIRVKCPDCEWRQFQDGEAVGMTPCDSCNSTGYIYEPLIEE